jgi:cytochrome P450 family 9
MDLLWSVAVLVVVLSLILGITILLLHLASRNADDFKAKGIHYLGSSIYRLVLLTLQGKMSFYHSTLDQYEEVKSANAKIAATKDFGTTAFWVQDPELLKHILIKDFDHFVDRRDLKSPKGDTLFGKMLVSHKGDQWKGLRSKLSPTFTTGKIKRMFQLMNASGKRFVSYLEKESSLSEGGGGEIEMGDAYSKLTMDVIAAVACGIDSKAFDSREPSLFHRMGNKLRFQLGGIALMRFIFMAMFPKVADLLGMTFFAKEAQDFFTKVVKSSIQHREETGEKRDDFIQLMLESRANQLKTEESELSQFEKDAIIESGGGGSASAVQLDDDTIVANCVLFIVGGFDTTQALMLFLAYVLALHPEVQDKLRSEIDTVLEETDGEMTYDGLNKIEYLDMVINGRLKFGITIF